MKVLALLLCLGAFPVCIISIIVNWDRMASEVFFTFIPGGWWVGILMFMAGALLLYKSKSLESQAKTTKNQSN